MRIAHLTRMLLLGLLSASSAGAQSSEAGDPTHSAPPRIPPSGVNGARVPILDRQQEIHLALAAGPPHLRDGAAVYVFGAAGYERIRESKNGVTCLVNRDGGAAGPGKLFPTCWDAEGSRTIVPVTLRVGELLAQGKSIPEITQDIDSGFSSGRFQSPRRAGVAYMLVGDVELYDARTGRVTKRSFPPHYMIYAPNVTNDDIGMTVAALKRDHSLPIVWSGYTGGAHLAYIIVPAGAASPMDHDR